MKLRPHREIGQFQLSRHHLVARWIESRVGFSTGCMPLDRHRIN